MTSARELHSLVPETGGKTQTDLHRSDTFTRQTVTRHRTLGYLMGALLCALVVGCSQPPVDYAEYGPPIPAKLDLPSPDSFDEKEDAEAALMAKYAEARAVAEGYREQADIMRNALAREGSRNTAKWFNRVGTALLVVSALLAVLSIWVGPTIIPRRLAWSMAAVGGLLLIAGYALIKWFEAAAWLSGGLLLVLAAMAAVAVLPVANGWFRRKLEAKGRVLLESESLEDKVRGISLAEAANPKARRLGRYPPMRVEPKPQEAEVGA